MKKFAAPLIFIGAVLAIIGVVGGIKMTQFTSSGGNFVPPPASVSVFETTKQVWPNSISAIGTVRSKEGITINAEVAGPITKIYFESGDLVQAGDLLLEQESGNERAILESAKAQLRLADYNYSQVVKLRKKNTVSESRFKTAKQELESAKANVENLQSNLNKKLIHAPFSGRLGIRKVDLGQDLQAGTTVTELHAHDKLEVTFPIPQRWLTQIETGQTVQTHMIEDASASVGGAISAIDSAVNKVTRNVEVEATLEQSEGILFPGMAVQVEIALPEKSEHLVVPSTAIIYAPFGDTVFVVEKDKESGELVARQQFIQIGAQRGDFVAIKVGLKEGEKVASAGAFKLFNGQRVAITEQAEVAYSLTPNPSDS